MDIRIHWLNRWKARAKMAAKKMVESSLWRCGLDVKIRRAPPGYRTRDERSYDWICKYNFATVLDIGAHEGDRCKLFRRIFPGADIHAFEPLVQSYGSLVKRMGQAERFSAYNYALGETEGTAKFHRSQAAETSSLLLMTDAHKHAYPHTAPTSEVAVEVRRLDSVLTAPLARPAFAKIDVQGAEASVLRGGSATLAQVDLLIIETSFAELYAGQPLFGELYELLLELGFEYAGSFDQLLHPKDERILQQDAIFLRRANA